MSIYLYRCNNPACRQSVDSTYRGDALGPCPQCPTGVLTRKWSVNIGPIMQEHLNATTGKVTSSMRQHRDNLRRASEEYSNYTGIASDFQPREWGELGATDEGLDRANKSRVDKGLPALHAPS